MVKNSNVDYKNGKIYKLVNDINDNIYIGSTTQLLCKRMAWHRTKSKTGTSNLYNHMREIGIEQFKIILIENYSCNSKNELEARERYYIEFLKSKLNMVIPTRTDKEYKENNNLYIREHINCECGLTYSRDHKGRHMKSQNHIKLMNDKTETKEEN